MTNDEKLVTEYERGDFLVEIANALSIKRGEYYVMLSSVWPPIRMRLILARADQIMHDDIIIDKTIEISRGGMNDLQSKFRAEIGHLERFADLQSARVRFEQLLRQVSQYKVGE